MNVLCISRMIVVSAMVSIAIPTNAIASCWYPDEAIAAQVKDFQYMLMVGSLQCKNTTSSYAESYNAFATKQRGVLDSKAYVLKAHFLRENGIQGGRGAYDSYNTMMSNRHAGRFDDASFCMTISAYTRMAATASDTDFVALALSVIEPPRGSCGNGAYVSPEPEPLPPPRRIESAYAPEPGPAPRDGYAPDPGPVAPSPYGGYPVATPQYTYAPEPAYPPQPAYSAAPVSREALPSVADDREAPAAVPVAARVRPRALAATVIAPAPIVPPAEGGDAGGSQAQALQAAISALQAATEALRAQTHPG